MEGWVAVLEARVWSGIGMLERVIADLRRFRVIFFLPPVMSVEGPGLSCQRLDTIIGFQGLARRCRAFALSSRLEMRGRLYSLSRSYAWVYTVSTQVYHT